MVKKAWFFGDSFTAGYGATEEFEYYKKYGPGKTFSNLLSEYYNAEENNFGLPGRGNESIFQKIIENLINIKEGDLVILSNTSPWRGLVPTHSKGKLDSHKLTDCRLFPDSVGYNDEEISEILLRYCVYIKGHYLDQWNHYYRKTFLDFTKYFQSKGCTAIFWDYSVWSEDEEPGVVFDTIRKSTNGELLDIHWSYRGHKDAYEWIKRGIEEKKVFLKFDKSNLK